MGAGRTRAARTGTARCAATRAYRRARRHRRPQRGRQHDVERLSIPQDRQVDGHAHLCGIPQIEQRLDRVQALAVDRGDPIAHLEPGCDAGRAWRQRANLVLPGNRTVGAFEADADRRHVADQVHPLHAVRGQQCAEDDRQRPAGKHRGSVRRIRPVLQCWGAEAPRCSAGCWSAGRFVLSNGCQSGPKLQFGQFIRWPNLRAVVVSRGGS